MKNALFLTAALALSTAPLPVLSAPYCDELGNKDMLPSKYQKRGPFYSDAASGWIIGDDQLRADFTVTPEVSHLWNRINAEFQALGVRLVVMAAPPRPLFADQAVRDAAGVPATFVADEMAAAFKGYVDAMNGAGITAPDLLAAAQSAPGPYYFQRDTHWTPAGAAVSAAALAEAMDMTSGVTAPEFSETYDEKGSLSAVAEKVCGARPDAERVPSPDYAKAGDAASLLGDAPSDQGAIALVGTSFSNRYQQDAYRVADAISHFTGASVENVSISGGGMTGAMEAFIRTADINAFDVVVWEAPYTEPLTNISGLRQILGTLISKRGGTQIQTQDMKLSDKWTSVNTSPELTKSEVIAIHIPGVETGQLHLEFIDGENRKTRVKLRKSNRVSQGSRSDVWAVALDEIDLSKIDRIKFRLKGAKSAMPAVMRLLSL